MSSRRPDVARLPAYLLLGFWAVLQVFSGLGSLGPSSAGGVAYFAHLGGFALGLAVVAALRILQREPVWPRRRRSYYWRGGSYELDE